MRVNLSPLWLCFIGFMALGLASEAVGAASHSRATVHATSLCALTFHAIAIVAGVLAIVQNRTAGRKTR
jgi:nitrate reductase gamma subunit